MVKVVASYFNLWLMLRSRFESSFRMYNGKILTKKVLMQYMKAALRGPAYFRKDAPGLYLASLGQTIEYLAIADPMVNTYR